MDTKKIKQILKTFKNGTSSVSVNKYCLKLKNIFKESFYLKDFLNLESR